MSDTVCRNCGITLTYYGTDRSGNDRWRHSPGPGRKGCGLPSPIDRRTYDRQIEQAITEARKRL